MHPTIIVVTSSDEPNVPKVLKYLKEHDVACLYTDLFLERSFRFNSSGKKSSCMIKLDGRTINVEEVTSIWYRRPTEPKASARLSEQHRRFAENEAQRFLSSMWSATPGKEVFWMDRPDILRELEYNKPLQLKVAAEVDLQVPETLVTNDLDAAREFFDRWAGEVVLKLFGGVGLNDVDGNPLGIYTSRVTKTALDSFGDEIKNTPVMFQNYIPKRLELRITVVGQKVFACAIHSQDSERTKIDWRRYDFENVKHEPYRLPPEVEDKLLRCMRAWGLQFGAIDMILTPDGDHVFLEVNPSGQWGWIEALTGMPISKAIADLLADPGLALQ